MTVQPCLPATINWGDGWLGCTPGAELGRATLTLPYFSTQIELRGVIRMGTANNQSIFWLGSCWQCIRPHARRWKKIPE
jgi:hypothetical protein